MIWNKNLDKNKKILLVIVSLQFLVLGLTGYFVFSNSGGGNNAGDDSSFNFVIFFPIFMTALIPLLTNKNKKMSESKKARKMMALSSVAGLVLAVMIAFLVVSAR